MKALYIFSLATLLSVSARANNDDTNNNMFEPFNIKYRYTLIEKNGHKDCIGELNFSLNIPNGTKRIILQRTRPHYNNIHNEIIYSSGRIINFGPGDYMVNVSVEGTYWGTYFRIQYVLTDDVRKYSSPYYTDTYISQADLDVLNDLGVDDIREDESLITYNSENKTLSVSHPITCEIFDMLGRVLFTGAIEDCISLSGFNAGLIIVHCLDNNRKIVKKIKL
ncbi:MAG: hypothetical protein J6C44_09245 [Muribaculaceae bacterium]|nr:hypothetical protein [Muribaculaceae bacterium]